jgi:hypothetical protein
MDPSQLSRFDDVFVRCFGIEARDVLGNGS